ncbi:hypothetical protein Tco_0375387 [Tanacetum coccineum]
MGESSRKTSLERHEEHIEEILNHLDELSLDRIEHIEDKVEASCIITSKKQMGNNQQDFSARFKITDLEPSIEENQVPSPKQTRSSL